MSAARNDQWSVGLVHSRIRNFSDYLYTLVSVVLVLQFCLSQPHRCLCCPLQTWLL